MNFNLLFTDKQSKARAGVIETAHGKIETPIFMPVGTLGSVKGVHQHELNEDIKAQIILGNTYHLYLRPGLDILQQAGGLHKFMNWNGPILTDSGGYQVFSLAENRKLTAEGAIFKSHIDGSKHVFTPERVVEIQRTIGSDIMMALDECAPYPSEIKYVKKSLELTHQWLDRGIKHFNATEPLYGHSQTFFPIVQGSIYPEYRIKSAEYIASKNCEGNAIGGLAVGEPAEVMYEILGIVNKILPEDKPRYLMGVGTPVNLLESIALGVDMFDCVMPTRNGRNGMIFTSKGAINIRNNKWKDDFSPVDADGTSFVDHAYTRAYLRHLVISKEMLGAQIASIHNLAFYLNLVKQAREKILEGTFLPWKEQMVNQLSVRL
ncbi:MAG TPA: tRNA guanosine(34) transglycosylase Tgt [Bacteroidales bacterium]|nr:tRNA guanosine(34) transglycosylase Tgt [Bacteroidales bacterium]